MLKRGIAFVLVCIFCITSFSLGVVANQSTNAPVFTDVPANHWARVHIEKVSAKGLMGGVGEGLFKPADNMTKITLLIALSRMMGFSQDGDGIMKGLELYGTNVTNAGVASWAKEYIAYSIHKGLISDEDLMSLFDEKGNAALAKKQDVIIYLTRALGMEELTKGKTGILPYNDSYFIVRDIRPYVYVLIENGILDPKGDQDGNLNAHNNVTRAEVAKMLSVALDIVEKDNKEIEQPKEQPKDQSSNPAPLPEQPEIEQGIQRENVIGVMVEQVIAVGERMLVAVADDKGNKSLYDLDAGVKVSIDGNESTQANIKVGQRADIILKNNMIESINLVSVEEEIRGRVLNTYDYQGLNIVSIEAKEGNKTVTRVMEISKSAVITMNGKPSTFSKIEKGDIITAGAINKIITRVEGQSRVLRIKGIFEEFKIEEDIKMIIVNEQGEVEIYQVAKDAKVVKDSKASFFEELRKGNIVDTIADYNEVKNMHIIKEITAQSVKRKVEGYISEIHISKNPTISIENNKGQIETFKISRDGRVWLDNKECEIYDLRLNYSVSMQIESDEAVEIRATKKEKEEIITGTIKHINPKARIITMAVDKENNELEYIQVFIDYNASISLKGTNPLKIEQLKDGSRIMITGKKELGVFTANMILVLIMGE